MRKVFVCFGLFTATAVMATALAVRVAAQGQGPSPDALILEGPGSSIGVSVRDVTSEEAQKARLPQTGGAVVTSVMPGGPGASAGLRMGDLVAEFDGDRVRSARHLTRLVRETPAGRAVKSVIVRDGARQTLDITPDARMALGPFPQIGREIERQFRDLPRNFSFEIEPDILAQGGRARLGVMLSPLAEQLASFFGAKRGVLVSSVEQDSPAARAGLKAGDVIVAVNGRNVESISDVTESVFTAQPGSTLDIRIVRERKEMTLKAEIPERPRPPRPAESRRSREI